MHSNRSCGTLMSYTDHSAQRRFKSNAPVSAENVCLLFCIVILYFRGFDHMGAGGYLPDCVSCLTCVWRGGE